MSKKRTNKQPKEGKYTVTIKELKDGTLAFEEVGRYAFNNPTKSQEKWFALSHFIKEVIESKFRELSVGEKIACPEDSPSDFLRKFSVSLNYRSGGPLLMTSLKDINFKNPKESIFDLLCILILDEVSKEADSVGIKIFDPNSKR